MVTPIGSVDEALRLGADAVVVYVALAGENESEMIQYASQIGEACDAWGMPFIAEAEFPNAYQTLTESGTTYGADYLLRNARLCAELGADIVKVNWSGDQSSFEKIVRAVNVPVVVAGGTLVSDEELLMRMQQAVAVARGRPCPARPPSGRWAARWARLAARLGAIFFNMPIQPLSRAPSAASFARNGARAMRWRNWRKR